MRIPAAVFLLLVSAVTAQAQTTSTTGTLAVTDPNNVLGQGTTVSLTATNATYAATATFDSTTPTQVDAMQLAAAPAGSGDLFIFNFDNGSSAIQPGTFNIDAANSNASVTFTDGTTSSVCQAAFGTVTIGTLTISPGATTTSAFSNLQGNFDLACANVASTVSGTFTFAATTTPAAPPPQTPGGGSGAGGILPPHFAAPTQPAAPTTPTPPPSPTLSISAPAQTLLAPVAIPAGETTTLEISTAGGSAFNAPVTLSATSDQPGLALTFSRDTIPAPGTGTSNLTIDTSAANAGTFFVTVNAAGGGLTAATTFEVDIVCEPPEITGLSEPANTTIASGSSAQLSVAAVGIGAFAYQWYEGFQGITSSPIAGANGPTLTTPPLTSTRQFWVRVANACGSVDSDTATVSVSP